jgi:ligand-binding sensor domain-containing protein
MIQGELTAYTKEELSFPSSHNISSLFIDSSGGLWVSVEFGDWQSSGTQYRPGDLAYFDGNTWIKYSESDLPEAKFFRVTEAPDGSIWVAADSGGRRIYRFKAGSWTTYQLEPPGETNFSPRDIAIDKDGILWAIDVKAGRYVRYDSVDWIYDRIPNPEGKWRGMTCAGVEAAANGELWFACRYIIHRIAGDQTWTGTLDDGIPANILPESLATSPDGRMWIGTEQGVSTFDGENWTHYTREDGLNGDRVISIAVNDDGVVYLGTNEGISRFDGETWGTYVIPEEAAGIGVKSIALDLDGSLWFGSTNGLFHFVETR